MRPQALLIAAATSLPATAGAAEGDGDAKTPPARAAFEASPTDRDAPDGDHEGAETAASRRPHDGGRTDAHDPDDDAPRSILGGAARDGGAAGFEQRFVYDPGRIPVPTPDPNRVQLALRGTYQLRFRAFSDLPLEPSQIGDPSADLGQNWHFYHWLRFRSHFHWRDVLRVVGEIDFPRGFIGGPSTELVTAARDDFAEPKWFGVRPRQLFIETKTPIGILRAGQQSSHWGMGVLANDGDHRTLFGDVRRGDLVERVLFATRPMGAGSPLVVAVAGDVVFQDETADLVEGDRAFQAVGAIKWEADHGEIGLYGVYRHQEQVQDAGPVELVEGLDVGVADLYASFHAPLPGVSAYAFGAAEAIFIGGDTNFIRTAEQARRDERETILSYGGAARLGVVGVKTCGQERWGAVAVSAEYGYASGDADPYDGVTRRFTFDQNHNVGLVLFDHVLAWKTARAATLAQDPRLSAREPPGVRFLPSEGAVFGAQYFYPTVVVRPRPWLDLKGAVLIAESTAEVVDPYRAGALGDYGNFDGGDEVHRDLGVELDAGADVRIPVGDALIFNGGAEGGLLFPGRAFEDAGGGRLPTQMLLNAKLGVSY